MIIILGNIHNILINLIMLMFKINTFNKYNYLPTGHNLVNMKFMPKPCQAVHRLTQNETDWAITSTFF